MRAFINLFLTIVLPISTLAIIIAVIYFSTDYDLTKALRLGTLTGVFTGIGLSLLITLVLLIMRKIRTVTYHPQNNDMQKENSISPKGPVDQKIILLMDKELAFEVSLYAVTDQNIGEITHGDKRKGSISISTPYESITLLISTLTKHTSEIEIKANRYNSHIQQLIHYLKTKELSFMDY